MYLHRGAGHPRAGGRPSSTANADCTHPPDSRKVDHAVVGVCYGMIVRNPRCIYEGISVVSDHLLEFVLLFEDPGTPLAREPSFRAGGASSRGVGLKKAGETGNILLCLI